MMNELKKAIYTIKAVCEQNSRCTQCPIKTWCDANLDEGTFPFKWTAVDRPFKKGQYAIDLRSGDVVVITNIDLNSDCVEIMKRNNRSGTCTFEIVREALLDYYEEGDE